MATTKLSTPWTIHFRKLQALFAKDPTVHVSYDPDAYTVTIKVDDSDKAAAIEELIDTSVKFGNVELKVNVVPANPVKHPTGQVNQNEAIVVGTFFEDNLAVEDIINSTDPRSFTGVFVIFKPVVVQYFVDDLSDPYGLESTLYEDLARELITSQTVRFTYYSTAPASDNVIQRITK